MARAAFPKGTLCLRIGDQLGLLYRDAQFADPFPTRGQPAASPARLALVLVLQYAGRRDPAGRVERTRRDRPRVAAADGERLLAAADAAPDQPVLAQLPAVATLRRLWAEQYTGDPGQLRWREVEDAPSPAGLISPPYDVEARYSPGSGLGPWIARFLPHPGKLIRLGLYLALPDRSPEPLESVREAENPANKPAAIPCSSRAHTKHGRLANFAPGDASELRIEVIKELERLHRRPKLLLASFIRHARIPIRLRT